MTMKNRIVHIDLLKTIAVFFVILFHSTLYTVDLLAEEGITAKVLYFIRTILSTGVPLFFFVNGYLLFNQPLDLRKHIRKAFRLIIIVGIWAVILMPIYMVLAHEPFSVRTMMLSILNMDIPWAMNIYWFVGALVCIYIFFPALKALFDTNRKAFIIFTAVCAFLTFGVVLINQILGILSTSSLPLPATINYPLLTMYNPFFGNCGYTLVYFCAGGIIYEYEGYLYTIPAGKRNAVSAACILLSCALLFAIGLFYTLRIDGDTWDVVWNGYQSIFTLVNVVSIYALCLNFQEDVPLIREISRNSLGIYFTHELFIRSTRPWIFEVGQLCNLPFNLVYAVLIVMASTLLCIGLKKVPLLRKLI